VAFREERATDGKIGINEDTSTPVFSPYSGRVTRLIAKPGDKVLHFDATPGDPCYGILQNKYLLERPELKGFKSVITFNDDGTFTHEPDLILRLAAPGREMHHTDKNTLRRVKAYHPGAEHA